jgi:hypothetical protein
MEIAKLPVAALYFQSRLSFGVSIQLGTYKCCNYGNLKLEGILGMGRMVLAMRAFSVSSIHSHTKQDLAPVLEHMH